MKILVTGATGLVGAEVIRQATVDKDISEIVALARKPVGQDHPKIRTVIHTDFLDYTFLADTFSGCDACLWCLGISQSQVSKQQYHVITYDYTIAAAHAMLKANPRIAFVFVSGQGADPKEKSRTLFARVKGKAENALLAMPFEKLFIARPGAIRPVHKNPNTAWVNKLMIPFFPVLQLLKPAMVINSVQLARALLYLAKNESGKKILENKELKQIAGRYPSE